MRRTSALLGTSLLLCVLIIGTVLAAIFYYPTTSVGKVSVSTSTITATTITSLLVSRNILSIRLEFSNGTVFDKGILYAGGYSTNATLGNFTFNDILPGNYSLAISVPAENVYLPPTTVVVRFGINFAKVMIYPVNSIVLIFTNGLSVNGTLPGPPIQVRNGTAVRMEIKNNTTLIHEFAVVKNLSNVNSSNVLFDSFSDTLNAGGSTNDTFVVNRVGHFYYEDLIGSHAQDGEVGNFTVLP